MNLTTHFPVALVCTNHPIYLSSPLNWIYFPELSSVALGGRVLSVSDEFFAEAFQLLLVEVRTGYLSSGTSHLLRTRLSLTACTEFERPIWTKRCALQWLGDTKT